MLHPGAPRCLSKGNSRAFQLQYPIRLGSPEKVENYFKKKTTTYKEQNADKVRRYLDVLACFPGMPIIYIDETGMDTYLYRPKARAVRGQKVYAKVSGRRFERLSVVAGQVGA